MTIFRSNAPTVTIRTRSCRCLTFCIRHTSRQILHPLLPKGNEIWFHYRDRDPLGVLSFISVFPFEVDGRRLKTMLDALKLFGLEIPAGKTTYSNWEEAVLNLLEQQYARYPGLKAVLALTGKRRLVNDDPADPVLGVGPIGSGQNLAGTVLERLRLQQNPEQYLERLPEDPWLGLNPHRLQTGLRERITEGGDS